MAKVSRYIDRKRYFNELAETSANYILPYVLKHKTLGPGSRVMEIGCGEGGNLLPFARMGCSVYGTDIAGAKIENADRFFREETEDALFRFESGDFLAADLSGYIGQYDLVIIHDVIEHIEPEYKSAFLSRAASCLAPDGVMYVAFPDWYMPFGGHQQICLSKLCSHLPFAHLMPLKSYLAYLRRHGEPQNKIDELASIYRSRMTVGSFSRLSKTLGLKICDRSLWLFNPHYKVKFHLPAVPLFPPFSWIPGLRDMLSTSCFFLLSK